MCYLIDRQSLQLCVQLCTLQLQRPSFLVSCLRDRFRVISFLRSRGFQAQHGLGDSTWGIVISDERDLGIWA